jgi:hypothetical protein
MGLLSTTIGKLNKPAILVGNGINLCHDLFPNWDELLKKHAGVDFNSEGLTNTEIYDFIELRNKDGNKLKINIAKYFNKSIKKKLTVHSSFMELVSLKNCPVLTTNFDFTLEHIFLPNQISLFRTSNSGFTDFYPWDMYYGREKHQFPTDGFGIWHIHGMSKYYRSIRLGLTDYMGSVERARRLIHKGDDRLFNGKNQNDWNGKDTWLHIWFNCPIIIVGLKLKSDEIFIRWLLIERERYFKAFPLRRKKTYYLSVGDSLHLESFLENLKIIHLKTQKYELLYQ